MRRRPAPLFDILAFFSIYPLLIILLVVGTVACLFLFNLGQRLVQTESTPRATRAWRLALLPTVAPTRRLAVSPPAPNNSRPQESVPAAAQPLPAPTTPAPPSPMPTPSITPPVQSSIQQPEQSQPSAPVEPENPSLAETGDTSAQIPKQANQSGTTPTGELSSPSFTPSPTLDLSFYEGKPYPPPTSTPRPTASPTPEGLLRELVTGIMKAVEEPTVAVRRRTHHLPTLTPTPTATETPTSTATATETSTPLPSPTPTITPTATPSPPPTNTPPPTATPAPTNTPRPTAVPSPTATLPPTATPVPEYSFLLNEFFNSPTTNSFLVMYVAITDANDVPIGDMKVVGTRLDHNLTYKSPPSTWHFEGYNAPGEVIKSGNVKFEPPGGIEDTSWIIHLEDAHGNRMSADVPFDTRADDKQWYFVKFKRKN